MTKKHTAQILMNRPFDINDGERYMIICKTVNGNRVINRIYKDRIIYSDQIKSTKTFKNLKELNKVIENNRINLPYDICQVKDLFINRYYVELRNKHVLEEPNIRCYSAWFLKGEDVKNTYEDYKEAEFVLNKYKGIIAEYYYQLIMKLKDVELHEIKKRPV